MRRPLVIAHRGADGRPDNTLEAVAAAIACRADRVEVDVRRTCDGELVALHRRHVGGRPVGRLSRREIAAGTGTEPPRFEDVVRAVAGRAGLDVDLHDASEVDEVLAVSRRHLAPSGLILTSREGGALRSAKRTSPSTPTGLLVGLPAPVPAPGTQLRPVRRAQAIGADALVMHELLARAGGLRLARRAGLATLVWNPTGDRALRRFLSDPDVAGVITDEPARAVRLRERHAPRASSDPRHA